MVRKQKTTWWWTDHPFYGTICTICSFHMGGPVSEEQRSATSPGSCRVCGRECKVAPMGFRPPTGHPRTCPSCPPLTGAKLTREFSSRTRPGFVYATCSTCKTTFLHWEDAVDDGLSSVKEDVRATLRELDSLLSQGSS